MNKYLEKIASFEKSALTRLVKEMIKRRGAGLPVSEAGFHELARRGGSRSMLTYAKGIKKRDNKFMKQLGVKTTVNGQMSELFKNHVVDPNKEHIIKHTPFNEAHLHRMTSNYDPFTKTIDSQKTKTKGLLRSHEVHEATEAKKIGLQAVADDIWSKTPDVLKPRVRNVPKEVSRLEDLDPLIKEYGARTQKKVKEVTGFSGPSPHGHVTSAVLGRESNDIRTNPFANTLMGKIPELRQREGEHLKGITGKRYAIDKFTSNDLKKLRKPE